MDEDWKVAKGTALEDIVAELLRGWGFDTQTRVRAKDKSEVEHEIDVLGKKHEAFGEVILAVECKNHSTPIDIKEIRNFRDKLNSLGYTKGLFISNKGFTPPALQYAKSVGIETWDGTQLDANIGKSNTQANTIPDAIEPSANFEERMIPHLENSSKLKVSDLIVQYSPYYFLTYHCFTQQWVNYQLTNLESKGLVVVDGTTGAMADYSVESGVVGSITQTGNFASCDSSPVHDIAEQELKRRFQEVKITKARIKESEVRQMVQLELAKSIWQTYSYQTGKGSYVRDETKTIRPKVSEVGITSARLANVPVVTLTLGYGGRKYTRTIQAGTIRMITDDFWFCNVDPTDRKRPKLLCDECGSLACEDHGRPCFSCGRQLCIDHIISKGLLQKKFYCKDHVPRKV